MSLAEAIARVNELRSLTQPQPVAPAATPTTTATAGSATGDAATAARFAQTLARAQGTTPFGAAMPAAGTGQAMVAAATTQLGVSEQPPGSNDSPQIAVYRQAVEGAPGPGPWCAYFVSWAARQSGAPLGETGQGFGSVDAMWSWAQRAGRGIAAGPGVVPQVGDIIVLNQHTGLVTGVTPDGRIQTIEGNTSNTVAHREHPPGAAIGYIRMG
ncbi:MAG: CHAP domain-containing protein [Solirubrobacteraceae bacterium]|nr:CHAP domain-containing protein [Solirubrobacteraceae bacterium]